MLQIWLVPEIFPLKSRGRENRYNREIRLRMPIKDERIYLCTVNNWWKDVIAVERPVHFTTIILTSTPGQRNLVPQKKFEFKKTKG